MKVRVDVVRADKDVEEERFKLLQKHQAESILKQEERRLSEIEWAKGILKELQDEY